MCCDTRRKDRANTSCGSNQTRAGAAPTASRSGAVALVAYGLYARGERRRRVCSIPGGLVEGPGSKWRSPDERPTGRSAFALPLLVVALIGLAGLVASAGGAQLARPSAKAPKYLRACAQKKGSQESVGDLNIRLGACGK